MIARLALSANWCGSWLRGGVALLVLCVVVLVPGLFRLGPIDRDESRFAQASRQMAESGDYVVPRVQDRPRLNKPPLIYWMQAGAVRAITKGDLSRDAIWMYRVPGALCMIASVLLTWLLGCSMFDARVGWLAAGLLGVCPLLVFDAHQARADQALLTTVVAAQLCVWKVLRLRAGGEASWWMRNVWCATLWACVGLGVLAKGPITPMVVALGLLAFCVLRRDWMLLQRVRPVLGVVIVTGMVLPWVLSVSHSVGWETYWRTIVDETLGRSTRAMEGHFGPPGYHLLLLVVLFFPGSLLTGLAVAGAWKRGAHRLGAWWRWRWVGKSADLFLLSWVLPSWVVFELIMTKLPHYTMPLYPALALLTARAALASSKSAVEAISGAWARRGFVVWGAVGVVLAAVVPGAAAWWLMKSTPGAFALPGFGVALAGLVLAVAATWFALHARPLRAYALAAVALVGTYAMLLQALLPANDDLRVSGRIAEVLNRGSNRFRACAAVGYQEDSLVFLTRGRIERIAPEDAIMWARRNPDGIFVIRDGVDAGKVSWGVVETVRGFNYARSKRELVFVRGREGGTYTEIAPHPPFKRPEPD
jgi:4-amino-4-deoxy-L-arabinose transferase-like glycosyltransferase